MAEFDEIIYFVDSLSSLYDVPIRVSYYDTYCTIYVIGSTMVQVRHIEYKIMKRITLREKGNPCSLCYSEFDNDIACFICGNTCCTACICNIICVNYTRGIYVCPYCKCERKIVSVHYGAENHILETLEYLNTSDDHIELIMHELKKKYPILFTN
jgi:hypothetical protein